MKTILGLTAAVFGAGVIAHQDPSFEYPVVKPVLTNGPEESGDNGTDSQQKTISVRFKDASAADVFDWLSNQGVSFVTAEVPKDAKVTLTLSNVPLNEAIDAIGAALGGGWDRRGNVYVFERGRFGATTTGGWSSRNMPETFMFNLDDKEQAKKWADYAKQMQKQFGPGSDFVKQFQNMKGMDSKQFQNFNGPDQKQMEKMLQKQMGPGSDFQKQFQNFNMDQKQWQEQAKQMQKQFGPGSDFVKQFQNMKGMDSKQFQNFNMDQKQWQEQAKQMQKQFGPGSDFMKQFKNMKGIDQKQWDQMQKQFQQEMGPNSPFQKQMKSFKFDKETFVMPKMDSEAWAKAMKAREEALKTLEQEMKSDKMKGLLVPPLNDPRFSDQFRSFSPDGQDLKGLVKSLTDSQRQKNKRQGYLNWSDLTPDQQRKLGMKPEGTWSITYSNNGESFTVKSDSHR